MYSVGVPLRQGKLPNITTLLTEKIQDRIKAERTLMESTNSDHNTPAAL
ncbi:unnamed protein product [Ixodes pacificus]